MRPLYRVTRTDVVVADPPSPHLLSPDERDRYERLRRPQDRADFVAARTLVRELLDEFTGSTGGDWSIVQRCATCGGPHGRPQLVGERSGALHLSWAHSDGLVAAAVADGPVGIDVEHTRGDPPPLPRHGGPPLDRWLGWVRGEALVKLGVVDLDGVLTWPLTGAPGALTTVAGARLSDAVAPDGSWVAALAWSLAASDPA